MVLFLLSFLNSHLINRAAPKMITVSDGEIRISEPPLVIFDTTTTATNTNKQTPAGRPYLVGVGDSSRADAGWRETSTTSSKSGRGVAVT